MCANTTCNRKIQSTTKQRSIKNLHITTFFIFFILSSSMIIADIFLFFSLHNHELSPGITDKESSSEEGTSVFPDPNTAGQKARKGKTFYWANQRLLEEHTSLEQCRLQMAVHGHPNPSWQQCLDQLVLPFGQYRHCSFLWLVENAVGYLV